MNVIARLEKNIGEVELMLAEDRAWLKAEPDSIAAQTQLAGTQNHLADLRHQLQIEKEKRDTGKPF